ncbi:hypothetical protein V8F33_003222 [Rhypophila sp. PSN 637]
MDSLMLSTARAKPQVRLGHALSTFEESLSKDKKAIFRSYRSQAASSTPTLDDVRRAVAEFDQQSGSRPYGSRFVNILKAVQQFAVVGDVVVGGGGNVVPSAVWGCLRLTLTVFTNLASCREKVSELFMEIGQTAPRHEQIAVLYPRSKRLQSDLIEYFIVIVQLCHRLFKPSTLGQIQARLQLALVDPELKNLKEELDKWATSIDREINLLIAQRVEEEAKQNSRFRSLWTVVSEVDTKRKKTKTRLTWLDSCSQYNYEREQKRIRKQGNSTFFLSEHSYLEWKGRVAQNSPKPSNLLLRGILGSGKSVLLANMIDDLTLTRKEQHYFVAHFFVISEDSESHMARIVLGSIARQILEAVADLSWVDALESRTGSGPDMLSSREILDLLRRVFPGGGRVFLILDGLDQCPRKERLALMCYLEELRKTLDLYVCASLRQEANVHPEKDLVLALQPDFVLDIPFDNPDIKSFVNSELEHLIDLGELVVGSQELLEEIKTCLITGASGMFLWVVLQLQTITSERSDRTIRQALKHIPRSLPATYEQILTKSRGFGPQYQLTILKILSAAFELLTIDQLREALSIVPGETVWSDENLINDINVTLASCGSLLQVDEEELTVRFVHPSVRQFLFNEIKDIASANLSTMANSYQFSPQDAHKQMAGILVTYLAIFQTTKELTVHQESSAQIEKSLPTLVPPPSQAIDAVMQSGRLSRRLVSVVSRIKGATATSAEKKAPIDICYSIGHGQAPKPNAIQRKRDVFLPYAKTHWLMHSKSLAEEDRQIYNLWAKQLRSYKWDNVSNIYCDDLKEEGVFQIVMTELLPTPFVWAIIYSHHLLLDQQLREYRKKDKLRVLIRCVETIRGTRQADSKMATRCLSLSLLLRERGATKTHKLLTIGPDLSYGNYGALYLAVILGNYPVVRRLVHSKHAGQDKIKRTMASLPYPLIERAVLNSDVRSLRLLVKSGANIDTHTPTHRHPLVEALNIMVNSVSPDPRHILIFYTLLKAVGKSNRNAPRDIIRSQSYNTFDGARAIHMLRLTARPYDINQAESFIQPKAIHVKLYSLWLELKWLVPAIFASIFLVLFAKNTYTSFSLEMCARMLGVFSLLGFALPVWFNRQLAIEAGLYDKIGIGLITTPALWLLGKGDQLTSPANEYCKRLVHFWLCFAPLAGFIIVAPPRRTMDLDDLIIKLAAVVLITVTCYGLLWVVQGSLPGRFRYPVKGHGPDTDRRRSA